MRLFVRFFAFFMLPLLVSCATYQQTVSHMQAVKACQNNCAQRLQQCNQVCRNNCLNCSVIANATAAVHFNQYKHEQCVQGKIVALELQSFRDPLQCRKTTCACRADYDVCKQSCNGLIHKKLQVVNPC